MANNKATITDRQIVVSLPDVSKRQPHNSKIPDDLLPILYQRREQGQTLATIQQWLLNDHHISISLPSLSERLKRINQLNQAVAQAIYLQSAVASAEDVISLVDEGIIELRNTHQILLEKGFFSEARMYRETLIKYLSKKIDMATSGSKKEEEKDSGDKDIDSILSRMSNTVLPKDNE
jgi:hypothetical protein